MSSKFTIYTTADDCFALSDGTFNDTSDYGFLGQQSAGVTSKIWIPFIVPAWKGLQIVSAHYKVVAQASSSANTVKVKVGCEAADNPSKPTTKNDLFARTLTTAYLTNNLVDAWTAGTEYSFDITTAVQEILDRAGWVASNTMAVMVWDNGSSSDVQRAQSMYEHATYAPPVLEITYDAGGQVIIWSSE